MILRTAIQARRVFRRSALSSVFDTAGIQPLHRELRRLKRTKKRFKLRHNKLTVKLADIRFSHLKDRLYYITYKRAVY